MRYIKKQYLLGALAMMALVLTGCSKDDSLTEIKYNDNDDEETVGAASDDITKALAAIDGISGVQKTYRMDYTDSVYYFYIDQNIDHHRPELGTFKQMVALSFTGLDKNVVLYTHGYAMPQNPEEKRKVHLCNALNDANMVSVEHRYFGNSQPEPAEELMFTYLNAEQQAYDLHHVVQTLKQHFFTGNSKWGSTGTSKDGITSALYAYYSDQNGWKDIDVFVPFCAPFLPGVNENGKFSCLDPLPGTYLEKESGSGYPEGSKEAIAFQRIHDIPKYFCGNPEVRTAMVNAMRELYPSRYKDILQQYNANSLSSTGDLTKDVTALAYYQFSQTVHNFFSYVPFTSWAPLVPDPAKAATDETERKNLVTFLTMSTEELIDSIYTQSGTTKSYNSLGLEVNWELLQELRYRSNTPYQVQAFKELGYFNPGYTLADGTYLTSQQIASVVYDFSIQSKFDGIYKQDNGQLMRDFRQWVYTENTQPIIFVYAKNDPWTGGRPDDAAAQQNQKITMVIDPQATHTDNFMSSSYYTENSKQAILSALSNYVGTGN